MDLIGLAQDRKRWRALVNFGDEPSGSVASWETGGFSSNVQPHTISLVSHYIPKTCVRL
jgi:hypothetical protein